MTVTGSPHRIAAVRHGEQKVGGGFDRLVVNRGDEVVHEGHVSLSGEGFGDAGGE